MRAPSWIVIAVSMIGVVATVVQRVEAAEPAPGSAEQAASEAASDDGAAAASKDARFSLLQPAQTDHRYQTGLSIMPGTGFRAIVPYEDHQACGDSSGNDSKRVCTHRSPFFIDLQLSFAPGRRVDIIADFRFSLGTDPATKDSHQFAFAPGLRFWLDQEVDVKFYTTLQMVYDQTEYAAPIRSSDFGVRNANGLMYDPIRNVGFFVQLGETIGFLRWFRMELDLGVGVQLRFP